MKRKKFFKTLSKLCVAAFLLAVIFLGVLIADASSAKLNLYKLGGGKSILFYDNKDSEVSADLLSNKKPQQQLNDYTYNAFIAIEDKRFFEHNGIDTKRIIKAAINNIKSFSFKEGASTITQQLIKNTQLSNKKSLLRKSREIKLALELEKAYTKQQILEAYLNNIYFGSGCYGIESASLHYFNKSASELTLNESAALAAIIKAPANYSPFSNYDKMITRKDTVLKCMYEQNYISQEKYLENKGKDIVLCKAEYRTFIYDDYIRESIIEVSDILNIPFKQLYSQNLKIYTYMDKENQIMLHNITNNKDYYKDYSSTDAVALLFNNKEFSLSAISKKSNLSLNRIIRQPGSAIKPVLVYAPALEYNLVSPCTEILDEKTSFGDYYPSNYNDRYYGWINAKTSLAKSLNIPAVKIFSAVGCDKAKIFASRCGIKLNKKDNHLGLALGGLYEGVSIKELAASYIPFSNGGFFKKPKLIKKITDHDGKILYCDNEKPQQIMRDDSAYLISDMLKESVISGTASKLASLNLPLCSKTGTVGYAEYNTDAYNISYTTENTFAVWMGGINNNKLDVNVTGGTYPTIMIKDIIKNCYKNHMPADISCPESVTECLIDLENLNRNHTLKLATEFTPERYVKKMLFSRHFLPNEYSDCFTLPCVEQCEVKNKENSVTIMFNAKSYLSYDIIRADENEETVIYTLQDKEGIVTVTDESLTHGKTYQYYIIPHFINKNLNKTIKGRTYMSNKIVIPYKFSPKNDNNLNDKYEDEYDDDKWWQDDDDFIDFDIDFD